MLGDVAHNLNEAGTNRVQGIAIGNRLGPGIEVASLPELGQGGTWSTCTNGCNMDPPQDVAHVQFRSRIALDERARPCQAQRCRLRTSVVEGLIEGPVLQGDKV